MFPTQFDIVFNEDNSPPNFSFQIRRSSPILRYIGCNQIHICLDLEIFSGLLILLSCQRIAPNQQYRKDLDQNPQHSHKIRTGANGSESQPMSCI